MEEQKSKRNDLDIKLNKITIRLIYGSISIYERMGRHDDDDEEEEEEDDNNNDDNRPTQSVLFPYRTS